MLKKNEIYVLMYNKPVGILRKDDENKLFFQYLPNVYKPISLSMPTKNESYEHRLCKPFFRGLMPAHKETLLKICAYYEISPVNTFHILKALGKDCLGAITFSKNVNVFSTDKLDYKFLTPQKLLFIFEQFRKQGVYFPENYKHLYPYCSNIIPVCVIENKIALSSNISTHFLYLSENQDEIIQKYVYLQLAKKWSIPVPEVRYEVLKNFHYLIISRTDRSLQDDLTVIKYHQEGLIQGMGAPYSKKPHLNAHFIDGCFHMCNKTTIPAMNRNSLIKILVYNQLMHFNMQIMHCSMLYKSLEHTWLGPQLDFCHRQFEESAFEFDWKLICEHNGYSYKAMMKIQTEMMEEMKEAKIEILKTIKI